MISVIIVAICLVITVLSADFALSLFINAIIGGGLSVLDYILMICLTGLHIYGIKMEVICLSAVIYKYKKKKSNKEVM